MAGPRWLEQAPCRVLPCEVQTPSRTPDAGLAPLGEAGLCVALLIGVPKNKKYLLKTRGHTRNLGLGDQIEKVIVALLCSFLCGDDSDLFHI